MPSAHLRRLVCVTDEQRRLVALQRHLVWWDFRDLKPTRPIPTPERRTALRQRFERVFGRVTGFTELDDAVARLRANKDELLLVLMRPEIPLHTNGSEHDIRMLRHQAQDLRRDPRPKPASRRAIPSSRC